MKFWANDREHGSSEIIGGILLSVALVVCSMHLSGCGKVSAAIENLGVTQVKARTAEDSIETFLTYQEALVGKDAKDVEGLFGKPKGIFEKRNGRVWMYSRWCVEFDRDGQVVKLERDIAASGCGGGGASKSMALPAKSVPSPQPVASSGGVTKISNGGQAVDLNALMAPGKITLVDFYADWCGPCRQISPRLEKLAGDNPNVVLVKVDIVKWGTPVAKQYGINSVPNVRVFDRSRNQVGEPSHNLAEIQANLQQAGR